MVLPGEISKQNPDNLNVKVPEIKTDKDMEILNKNFNSMISRLKNQQQKLIINERYEAWGAFCDVKTGKPGKLDELEPIKISQAVKKLNLKHVVITSVDRDDLNNFA